MISMALVYNISLLITLTIFREALLRIFPKRGTLYSLLSGLLFGFVTMVGMMTPLKFLPGIIFDGRSIVLGVAGLFDGLVGKDLSSEVGGVKTVFEDDLVDCAQLRERELLTEEAVRDHRIGGLRPQAI